MANYNKLNGNLIFTAAIVVFAIVIAIFVIIVISGTVVAPGETTIEETTTATTVTPSATYGDYLGMARVMLPGATPEEVISMAKRLAIKSGESLEFIRTFWGTEEPEPETELETKAEVEPTTLATRDDMPIFDRTETWALRHLETKVFFVKDPGPETPWGQAFAATKAKIAETAALRADAVILAHCIRGEASVIPSRTRAVAVAEMILNQIDFCEHEFAKIRSIKEAVIDRPNNIRGYWLSVNSHMPLEQIYIDLAIEVMARREMEHQGWEWSGRILPAGYVFEYAANGENYFMPYEAYHDLNKAWNWDLPTPYRS